MKKAMLRFTALALAVILLLSAVGCRRTAEELEKKYDVSYDNIICDYSYGCAWDDPPYKRFTTHITIYADNTVRIWTTPGSNVLAEYHTLLSAERTQALINAFRKYNMFDIDNSVDEGILDGWSSKFRFYNSSGEEVYSCWGSNFTPGYSNVEDLLLSYFPLNGGAITAVSEASELKMSILYGAGEAPPHNYGGASYGYGETLNIYCWNEQFKDIFEQYYTTPYETIVNWIINPGIIHYERVDEALSGQYEVSPADRIDLFLVDTEHLSKYIELQDVLSLSSIYYTPPDTMYQYTIDACTDSYGELKGIGLLCNPGTLVYRRSIARDVLGTDDPAQVQEKLNSWKKFEEAARIASDKGYYMTASFADTMCAFSPCSGIVSIDENNALQYSPNANEWINMTKALFDNNSTLEFGVWDTDEQKSADGKTMCFFGPSWYHRFYMYPAWETCPDDWAICQGPQAYFNGDVWLLAAAATDNPAACYDIIEAFTTDPDICMGIIDDVCIPNNSQFVKEYSESSGYESFFKEQNEHALLDEIAQNITYNDEVYAYSYALNTAFSEHLLPYFNGSQSLEAAMDNFEEYVRDTYLETTVN